MYSSSSWGDLLIKYGSQNITFDEIGNTLSDGTRTYTWEHGRQLKTTTMGGKTWTYTYDPNGMRTTRSYGSTTYQYVYNGSQLTQMTVGSVTLQFIYSATGAPMAVIYNGDYYYYLTNIQGDVVALLDTDAITVVSYTYDAWGNVTVSGSMDDDLGIHNPLRYRGYVYDQETGLYYLQSRYYNPEIGRFISADDASYLGADGSTASYNLFAYCNNNPVMGYDPSGHAWITSFLIGLAVSSLITWVASEIFGGQIVGGASSVVGGASAIYTGISLFAFGPAGWIAGGALIIAGAGTAIFGANEVAAGITGTNYIQEWTGWSDDLYNGLYIGLNIASSVGTIAGNIGMRIASNNILNSIVQEPSKITSYKLWQIKTFGRYSSNYVPGVMRKGSHAGQGYTLTNRLEASLGYIQWHPGGGHHGPLAYWKVTSSSNPTKRYFYLSGLPF